MIITIDGPVATGKSTIAKKVAHELGYIYFDTGAMYRCLSYGIAKQAIDISNNDTLKKYLDHFQFEVRVKHGEKRYFVENEDVTEKIRNEAVTSIVSKISAIGLVREKLVSLQRDMSEGVHAVYEGRDMGTVVFPNANLKIFLTGRPEVRAQRRFAELKQKFPDTTKDLTLDQALQDINERDRQDTTRAISPLKKASDAIEVDTSDLTIDEIVQQILEYKDDLKNKRPPRLS